MNDALPEVKPPHSDDGCDPGVSTPLVVPSNKGRLRLLSDVLNHGGPGYLQFAITNICNARCEFCGFAVNQLESNQRRSVTLAEARDVIDVCVRNRIGYLLFVGGEPMVHRDLPAMVRYATQCGIRPMICTNGSLWTDDSMRRYAADGLSSVIMSIDAPDRALHERHRGLADVCRKIQDANRLFAHLGVQAVASVTVSRLIRDYSDLPAFLSELGFRNCTFSYPLTTLGSSYLSCSKSDLVSYTKEELIDVFDRIKELKRAGAIGVLNPLESLSEMQRHLRGEPERFECLGGYKYFYLDWNLNLYRCHYWEEPMCHIGDFEASKLIRDGCTRCMIDCYRDPSVLQFVAVNASDAWNQFKRGKLIDASRRLLDRRNLTSLWAVWENRKWIGDV